jgi:hypothetical protein
VFPDSDIVKKPSRGRAKAEAIVPGILAPASVDASLGILHRNMIEIEEEDLTPYFSIASDASNYGSSKMFPLAIQFWTSQDVMHNRMLDFYSDPEESAGAIANQLTSSLEKMDLSIQKVSAFSADNASVNYGKHSSVFQNLKKVNDRIIAANCPTHILHNAAKKASDKMAADVEVLVVKIFNNFSSSAKHTAAKKSIFAFLDNGEENRELLRHVTTRWLTLHPAIVRLGQNWPCVKSYFLSLGENDCPKFL